MGHAGKLRFDEIIEQGRRGELAPASVAVLFGVHEDTFRRLALRCYPLSLPADAMAIAATQVMAALQQTGEPQLEGALRRLRADPDCLRVVTLLLQSQG